MPAIATSKNVFEAILRYGHDEDFCPRESDVFMPTDALPGTSEKIEVLRRRVDQGQPLWHAEDRIDYAGTHLKSRFGDYSNEPDQATHKSPAAHSGDSHSDIANSVKPARKDSERRALSQRERNFATDNGLSVSDPNASRPLASFFKKPFQSKDESELPSASAKKSAADDFATSESLLRAGRAELKHTPVLASSPAAETMADLTTAAFFEPAEHEISTDKVRLGARQQNGKQELVEPPLAEMQKVPEVIRTGNAGVISPRNEAFRADSGTSVSLRPHVQAGLPADEDIIARESKTSAEKISTATGFEALSFGQTVRSVIENEKPPKNSTTENGGNSSDEKNSPDGVSGQKLSQATRSESVSETLVSRTSTTTAYDAGASQRIGYPQATVSSNSASIEKQVKYYMDNVGVPRLPFENPELLAALEQAGYIKALERLAATNGAIKISD